MNLLFAQSVIASEMPSLENGTPDPFSKQLNLRLSCQVTGRANGGIVPGAFWFVGAITNRLRKKPKELGLMSSTRDLQLPEEREDGIVQQPVSQFDHTSTSSLYAVPGIRCLMRMTIETSRLSGTSSQRCYRWRSFAAVYSRDGRQCNQIAG